MLELVTTCCRQFTHNGGRGLVRFGRGIGGGKGCWLCIRLGSVFCVFSNCFDKIFISFILVD